MKPAFASLHGPNGLAFAAALLVLVLAGCTTPGPSFDPRAQGGKQAAPAFSALALTNQLAREWLTPPADFYRLGPGDVLEIEILGEPTTRAGVTVGPDGKIYYGLLPGSFVWGRTLSETKAMLEDGLAKFIRVKPEVSLTLSTVVSKKVWLLGSLRRPGVYALAAPMTLLEAVSAAGGTVVVPGTAEEMADLEKSFVMRAGKMLPVNLAKLLRQGDLSQNIYLQSDDFVYLRSGGSKDISVLGGVVRPNLVDYTEQSSVLSAITAAGGTAPYAYVSHVLIIRGALTQPMIATVDYNQIRYGKAPDVRLLPGDIVYVPLRPFEKLEKFANIVLEEFVRTVAINEGRNAVQPSATPVAPSLPFFSR